MILLAIALRMSILTRVARFTQFMMKVESRFGGRDLSFRLTANTFLLTRAFSGLSNFTSTIGRNKKDVHPFSLAQIKDLARKFWDYLLKEVHCDLLQPLVSRSILFRHRFLRPQPSDHRPVFFRLVARYIYLLADSGQTRLFAKLIFTCVL